MTPDLAADALRLRAEVAALTEANAALMAEVGRLTGLVEQARWTAASLMEAYEQHYVPGLEEAAKAEAWLAAAKGAAS